MKKFGLLLAITMILILVPANRGEAQGVPPTPYPPGSRPAYCGPGAPASWYWCGWSAEYAHELQRHRIVAVRGGRNRMGGW